jgi:hypothetical protein
MELREQLRDLDPAEMRKSARDYRIMASTARTAEIRATLLRVAERLDTTAGERER